MAKNKLYWENEKKGEEKEGKKREEEKKKKREEKEKRLGEANRNHIIIIRKTTGEYLLILCTLSPLASPGSCPSSWCSGGGACCADFQVLALGGAALPPAWCRAQWGLFTPCGPRRNNCSGGASSGPWIQLPQELRSSPSAGPGGSGAGPLICSARGRSVLAVLGPPGLCLSRGEAGFWAVSRRPVLLACAAGFTFPPRTPLRGAAARAPPSCSGSRRARCSP